MSAFYREEPKKLDVVSHLEELRRRILISLGILAIASVFAFSQGEKILVLVKKPVETLIPQLIYIGPTEAFASYLKISLLAGFIISFPVMLYHAWAFIAPAISKALQGRMVAWFIFAFLLFIAGVAFSYCLAIPAALRFLINFGEGIAIPQISLGKYISFFGALILVGAVVFEIPVAIGLMTDAGLIGTRILRQKRLYAILAILVFAALITPTQDIVNMLMFALPMILLYEVGILLATIIEKRR